MKSNKGIFITGTDTGVGKTVVTALLAIALRKRGLRVGVMKPVETGCLQEGEHLVPQDALFLRQASGCTAPQELIVPYTFAEPLTPALTAERAGISIDLNHLAKCFGQLVAEHDMILVEGAGGLLAPLTAQLSMHDLAIALNLPILVVSCNKLGTLNHTALTVSVARQKSQVLGIILNTIQPTEDLAMQTNAEAIRRWGQAPLLGEVPYMPVIDDKILEEKSIFLDGIALAKAKKISA